MPNMLPDQTLDELATMLASLQFSDTSADQISNEEWVVRATLAPSETPDCFDAAICILPRNPLLSPVRGLEVSVQPVNGIGSVKTATTNALGQAWFHALEPGRYQATLWNGERIVAFAPPRHLPQHLKGAATKATPDDLAKEPELD